jgi:heme-degrading monooxygenase HmoA
MLAVSLQSRIAGDGCGARSNARHAAPALSTKCPVQTLSFLTRRMILSETSATFGIVRAQEAAMSIIRLIFISIDPADTEKAMQVWKTECAPLMISQKGCISEKLLRSREAHEFISYSEWESEADIEMYQVSDAHQEIVRHTRGLKGAKAQVKLYEPVN